MKMRIVTTTSVFEPGYPAEAAIDRLKHLGFEAQDMALDYWQEAPNSPFMGEDYLHWARALRERAERIDIPYTHSHAPAEARNHPIIARALETASALGARYMVLHPVCGENSRYFDDPAEFIEANKTAIAPWLKKARACKVVILSENLLWGPSRDPRVIAELVRQVGSEWFGWCYDTGHANCFGYCPEVLKECAAVPASLHIQDNHGDEKDEHLIPGDGTVDWDALTDTLRMIGYSGDCVLEAHHQSITAPDGERDAILTRLLNKARLLRGKMDNEAVPFDHAARAEELFRKGYNCAQAVFCAFSDVTGFDVDTSARMASSFGGGLGRLRETCGVVSAAALELGIVRGYDAPGDYEAKKKHYALVREFANRFKAKENSINCKSLLAFAGLNAEAGNDPELRSEEFYKKRPCPRLVYQAAQILDEMLK